MTSEEDEEESKPNEIREITQMNNIKPDNNNHNDVEMKITEKKQNFTIHTGSPVTIMPSNQTLYKTEIIQPIKERYQNVNKNVITFLGKVDVEYNNTDKTTATKQMT